jgi:hypothetical protein
VGELIAFADIVQARRRRTVRQLHAQCSAILAGAVVAAGAELAHAPLTDRWVWVRRLRKLEELAEYASAVG